MDIYRFRMVSDPQLSPEGEMTAFVVTEVLREDNKYRSRIHLVDTATGESRQFTGGDMDESPRWSPDGSRLAFISNRQGTGQLWVIPVQGGEAQQLTYLDGPVLSPRWSPDGRRITFTHRVDLSWNDESPDENGYTSDIRSYTRLRYKFNGEGYWDGKWRHVHVVDVATGEVTRVTDGEYDHSGPAWSPDGTRIAFAADRRTGADLDSTSNIYVVAVDSKSITQVTDNPGPSSGPAWSPGGELIAYYGHDDRYGSATLSRVWAVKADGTRPPECLTESFDRGMPGGVGSDIRRGMPEYAPVWDRDGSRLFSMCADRGAVNVFEVCSETGGVSPVTAGDRVLHCLSFSRDRSRMAFVSSDPLSPGEIHLFDLEDRSEVPLTDFNGSLLFELALSRPEPISYTGHEDWDIEGWIMKPVGFTGDKRYPLILKIHGGPHGAYGHSFNHHFQQLAGEGYVVLYVNPRGSSSYGQEFVKATHHDWGGGDYRDIMAGVDHALSLGFIDEGSMGVTGASFGGYMTNWILGQNDRFRAAVSEVTTSNRYSQWGTSDYGHGNGKWEFRGNPWASWENAQHYLERSPLTYVQNMKAPLLIIQAENDHRCPLEQAEQLYTALVVLGREVQLVIVPGESHGFSRIGKPRHREERLIRISEWFRRHLS